MAEFVDPDEEYVHSNDFKEKVQITEDVIAASPAVLRSEMYKSMTREQAIAYGRAVGENEADSRQEVKEARESRIKRAMAYAAWEFDGKPEGDAHLKEFGVGTEITPSLERAVFGRLLKKGKT